MTALGQRLIRSSREAVAIARGEADPPRAFVPPAREAVSIAAGLEDAVAIVRGEADPATYRVHLPAATPVPVVSPAQEVAASEREVRRAMIERFPL